MSIQELFSKFKGILRNPEYQLSALIIIVALSSFALGRASDAPLSRIENPQTPQTSVVENEATAVRVVSSTEESTEDTNAQTPSVGAYVASKNGAKYHLPWCPGAKQIKDENKIFFATKEDAEKAGYTPAANCKGI